MSTPAVIYKQVLANVIGAYINQSGTTFTLKLYTNNLTPTRDNVLADFTEASYPGYAAVTYSSSPGSAAGNKYKVPTGNAIFLPPSSGSPVDIYGFFVQWVLPGVGTEVLASARFAGAPITLSVGGSGIALTFDLFDYDANNP